MRFHKKAGTVLYVGVEEIRPNPRQPRRSFDQKGLEELAAAVEGLFPRGQEDYGRVIANARQAEAVRRALEGVERAGDALAMGVTPDALLTDVEQALSALGELTGQSVREDITDRIFERFCVGK